MSIDSLPIWALFAATVLIVIATIEFGYRLGRFAHQRSEEEKESPVSVITGSILGMLAFILAFTFGMVSNRFDARKELVREEANAIRTAWQRSDFLPETDRAEARSLLREYLETRLAFVQARDVSPEHTRQCLLKLQRIERRLWQMAVANARRDMNSDVAALYIESLNEITNLRATRVAVALQVRIPAAIWYSLMATMALGMMSVGYQTGIAGSKRSMSRPILAGAFALVIALIAELDRPDSTVIAVSQQPQIDLLADMNTDADGGEDR